MNSVLESHGPRESKEVSKVRIGLETTELRCHNEIDTVAGGRHERFQLEALGLDQRLRVVRAPASGKSTCGLESGDCLSELHETRVFWGAYVDRSTRQLSKS